MRTRSNNISHVILVVLGFISIIGYFWDRRDSERSREAFAIASKTAMAGIWSWDAKSNILSWDGIMFELYGKNPSEFTGNYSDFESSVHPEDRAAVNALIKRCLDYNIPFQCGFRIILPDGRVRRIHASGAMTEDGSKMIGVNLNDDIRMVYSGVGQLSRN